MKKLTVQARWRCSSKAAVIALSVRKQLVASGCEDGSLKIWDTTTGKVLHGFLPACFDGEPTSIIWLNATTLIVSAGTSVHRLKLDLSLNSPVTSAAAQTWPISNEEINSICLIDRKRVAVGDDEGRMQILNLETSVVKSFDEGLKHVHICTAVVYQEMTGSLISGGMDSKVKIWNTGQGMLSSQIDVNTVRQAAPGSAQVVNPPYVNSLACERKMIAAGLGDGSILLAEQRTSKKVWQFESLEGHTLPIGALCFLNSDKVISGSNDKTCRLWDLRTKSCIACLDVGNKINSMALVDDKSVILGDVSGQLVLVTIE